MYGYGYYIALAIFIIASLTDMADGKIARKYNLVTNFGKFMDPLADKLLVCSAMICLVDLKLIPVWVVLIIIAREFIISGFRLVASDNGIVIAASYWGKFKTTFQMLMVIVIIFNINLQLGWLNILGTILIYVALVLTVVSLIDYIAKNKEVLKGPEIDYNREKSMRIIAGTARSLPLKTIEGKDTRPTTDKTKETLFNVMQFDVPGAYFLDLFAGSGQIGLEALSRGAAYAVFVENSRKAASCIEDNIHFTKFDKVSRLMMTDAVTAVRTLEGKYKFDIVFMDPPYNKELEKEVLITLSDSDILKDDTLIVVEASNDTDFDYLTELGYEIVKEKIYKTNKHVFIKRA